MARRAVVIYHDNCNDGFGAAFAFWKWHAPLYGEENVEYVAASYGNTPPNVDKDTDVYILDFSYTPEVLVKLAESANYVKLLDHHKTAVEAWKEYDENECKPVPSNLAVTFDMSHSGAMMAMKYFAPAETYSSLFNYIQDRDLWQFKNPDTKAFHALLSLQPKEFSVWDALMQNIDSPVGSTLIEAGHLLLKQFEKQCEEIVRIGKRKVWIDGVEGLECNCPPMFASDVGNILAKESGTFGHTWMDSEDASNHSLRSIGDFDVSAVAKKFGGGGHKNAAGFKVGFEDADICQVFAELVNPVGPF